MSLFDDYIFRMNENGESWNDMQHMTAATSKKKLDKFKAAEILKSKDMQTLPATANYQVFTDEKVYYITGYAGKRWIAWLPTKPIQLW